MRGVTIDYDQVLSSLTPSEPDALTDRLMETLPALWRRTYRKMAQSPTNILLFSDHGMDILFDHASALVARDIIPPHRAIEDRVVVAFGLSVSTPALRSAGSMQRWVGPGARMVGAAGDRGHPMARALGGHPDITLFPQRRAIRREWSADGRALRAMERYCAAHPGTFCFSRPIYDSRTWWPGAMEYGVLREDGALWIRRIDMA